MAAEEELEYCGEERHKTFIAILQPLAVQV